MKLLVSRSFGIEHLENLGGSCCPPLGHIWVVVKIMVPFGGTLNNRCCIIIRTQKGAIILTTTNMAEATTVFAAGQVGILKEKIRILPILVLGGS